MTAAAPVMTERKAAMIGALLVALGPISMALYTPALPMLVEVFGTTVSAVKLTLTVYFAGFAAAQLVCGPLSDGFGRRPVVIGFTAIYLLSSLVAMFAPSVEWLMAARLLQGIGAAAGIAISRAMVRDLFTGQDSARVMNTIGMMLAVGPALSPTLGGVTLELFGWQAIFGFMALYGAAILIVVLTVVPETLAQRDPAQLRGGRLFTSYGLLLRDARFLRPSIILGCTIGALYALATILPFIMIEVVGLTPTEFGIGMLVQSGSFFAGSLMMRRLLTRTGAHRLVPVGLAMIGAGGLLLAVLMHAIEPTFLAVMGPIGLYAFGIAFTMPALMTDSLAPFGRIAGAASALTGFFQIGGGLLGSGAAALMGEPVLALGTIIPGMAAVAIATQLLLGHTAGRRDERTDEELANRTPAE
ncbi:multidrug effflux MFS transporter [Faunimonas sp. B44]|uniref:multidrug effflux MFS transporter n=1 Tax=Faunimonas sp. B44 TaxID=3461493 RepID=UPI004044C9E2